MPIPLELQLYRQWVVWKLVTTDQGKLTKVPYNPLTGHLASVTDAGTWTDYNSAVGVLTERPGMFTGLGFVLTKLDPYCFVDLDNAEGNADIIAVHKKIFETFDTYAEISPSGNGLHLICKGIIPIGRKRNKVEIYSSERYFTMTGNTYYDKPIGERQGLVQQLWEELAGNPLNQPVTIVGDETQIYDDKMIYDMAACAINSDKFVALWQGHWETYYPSQSEADFALINILSYYSRNREQIKRMFYMSALGKRDKNVKRPKLIEKMIIRSFDNQPPKIDTTLISADIQGKIEELKNPFAGPLFENVEDDNYDWALPPGIVGSIADFIYRSSPHPVKEISLGAALGLMAGICGRSYNISGTGLNQYILILAKTGTGKEAASSGIDHLVQAVRNGVAGVGAVPAMGDFIGPGDIASGQALAKYLPSHPCFVSIVGEFGLVLKQLCSATASGSDVRLRKMLLALYNKSGAGETLRPTIYSDKDQTTDIVHSPSFSILGESTPDIFYQAIDESMVAQGLFPRFTCIEYTGPRVPLNENHQEHEPSPELVQQLATLSAACLAMAQQGRVIHIAIDEEAKLLSSKFDSKCDRVINGTEIEMVRQLWTRAHMKALKLAGVLAVGINMFQPVVTRDVFQWAVGLVQRDIEQLMKRFETGKTGMEINEHSQIEEIRQAIYGYMAQGWDTMPASCQATVTREMHNNHVITVMYLTRKMLNKRQFKLDKLGPMAAIERAIKNFVVEGALFKMDQRKSYELYKKVSVMYSITDPTRFYPTRSK